MTQIFLAQTVWVKPGSKNLSLELDFQPVNLSASWFFEGLFLTLKEILRSQSKGMLLKPAIIPLI